MSWGIFYKILVYLKENLYWKLIMVKKVLESCMKGENA